MNVNQRKTIPPKKEIPSNKQSPSRRASYISSGDYAWKSVVAFTLKGTRYPVHSWKEMLIKIMNLMLSNHREQFCKVFNLVGRSRPYCTKNSNELRSPERIANTDTYIETNLSAKQIVKLSKNIIKLFGYSEDDLSIEAR